jgi:hypothetical protein
MSAWQRSKLDNAEPGDGMSFINSRSPGSKSASSNHSFMTCALCYGTPMGAKKARLPQSLIAGLCNRRLRAEGAPAMTVPNAGKAARSNVAEVLA